MNFFKHLLLKQKSSQQAGQGLVEYAIILIFVGIAVVAIVAVLEPSIANVFSRFVQNAPVAPPALVNYTPPPTYTLTPTHDPNATATSPGAIPSNTPVPSATATGTVTVAPTATQTPSNTPSPSATPVCNYGPYSAPGRVEAENFTCGGQGVGFNDTNAGGSGACSTSRPDVADRAVDLEASGEGTCSIGWIATGEWTKYRVTAPQTLRYDFVLRVAAMGNNGRVRIRVTNALGTNSSAVYNVPNTGGWQSWTNLRISDPNLFLDSGSINTVEIYAEGGDYNLNYFDVASYAPTATPTSPPTATPTATPTFTPVPAILTFEKRVATGNHDAEEFYGNGDMDRGGQNLDMGQNYVGIYIQGVTIPRNATITNAYIEFRSVSNYSQGTNLIIVGQNSNDASAFSNNNWDISSNAVRPKTTASVTWNNVPAWTTGNNYRSPDIKAIVQQIVNRGGWNSGNSMVFIVSGSGQRSAVSYNNNASLRAFAPLLHVEYTVP